MLRGLRYSIKVVGMFSGRMRWFGINFSASGFGVPSVWMKMVRFPIAVGIPGSSSDCLNCRDGRAEAVSAGRRDGDGRL